MILSESITNDLLNQLDSLTSRIRNIKQSLKIVSNSRLRERLINENITLIKRVNEIYNLSKILSYFSTDKINFSALLFEKSKRTLNETRTERNLYFL